MNQDKNNQNDNNRKDNADRVIHSDTASAGMSSDLPKDKQVSEGDTGQGSVGVQGQYAGNDQPDLNQENRTAPDRKDPDTMNQNGSSQLAMGSRNEEEKNESSGDEPKKGKEGQVNVGIQKNMNDTNDSQ